MLPARERLLKPHAPTVEEKPQQFAKIVQNCGNNKAVRYCPEKLSIIFSDISS
jgi:hypothetical protein